MELKSEYMLLSAPYRFELHHLTPLAPRVIAEDLLSVAPPRRASESRGSAMKDLAECAMRRLAAAGAQAPAEGGASALRLIADVYGRFPDEARISNDLSFAAKEMYLSESDGAGEASVEEAAQASAAPRIPDSTQTLDSVRALAPRLGPFEKLGVKKAKESAEEGVAFHPANLVIDQASHAASSTQWRVPAWLMAVADNRGPLGLSDAFVVFLLSAHRRRGGDGSDRTLWRENRRFIHGMGAVPCLVRFGRHPCGRTVKRQFERRESVERRLRLRDFARPRVRGGRLLASP